MLTITILNKLLHEFNFTGNKKGRRTRTQKKTSYFLLLYLKENLKVPQDISVHYLHQKPAFLGG